MLTLPYVGQEWLMHPELTMRITWEAVEAFQPLFSPLTWAVWAIVLFFGVFLILAVSGAGALNSQESVHGVTNASNTSLTPNFRSQCAS